VAVDIAYEKVTCEDGGEWVLFWVENEVAFVQPSSGELYKWRPEIYAAYPEVYRRPRPVVQVSTSGSEP
jgi:hypothetical protein